MQICCWQETMPLSAQVCLQHSPFLAGGGRSALSHCAQCALASASFPGREKQHLEGCMETVFIQAGKNSLTPPHHFISLELILHN